MVNNVYNISCFIFGLEQKENELLLLSDNAALHRKNLGEYTTDLIDQMLPVITSATIMSYSLYTFTSGKSHYMMFTILSSYMEYSGIIM